MSVVSGEVIAERIKQLSKNNPYESGLTGADMALRIQTLNHNSLTPTGAAGNLLTPLNVLLAIGAYLIFKGK